MLAFWAEYLVLGGRGGGGVSWAVSLDGTLGPDVTDLGGIEGGRVESESQSSKLSTLPGFLFSAPTRPP